MDVENSFINVIKAIILIRITRIFWWRKNIIILLLSLELLLISTFTLISTNLLFISATSLLIILTIIVAGSSLGLVLLVSLCRFFKSPNSLPIWALI